MKIYYADNHKQHDCAGEIKDGELKPCFENPGRADAVQTALITAGYNLEAPTKDFGLDPILRIHDRAYIEFLKTAWTEWQSVGRSGDIFPLCWPGAGMRRNVSPNHIDGKVGLYAFDSGTPICEGTYNVAYQGAQCALNAAQALLDGETYSFAFSRPPGHHAMPGQYGGYCFMNNIAIAAQYLKDAGKSRIAILDVDYHHGNGTQTAFYDRSDILVVNIHSDPADEYPYYLGHADETGTGDGTGYNLNLPLPKSTKWEAYQTALSTALNRIKEFAPEMLLVSFGADTYKDDPLGYFKLEQEDFSKISKAIATLKLPTAIILEGGYAIDDLGENTLIMLEGMKAG
jgi:acetoin utilization deacetylase AcuC-like enzyme